eukprot:5866968-Alexandrium_andersonii.AAC.1
MIRLREVRRLGEQSPLASVRPLVPTPTRTPSAPRLECRSMHSAPRLAAQRRANAAELGFGGVIAVR